MNDNFNIYDYNITPILSKYLVEGMYLVIYTDSSGDLSLDYNLNDDELKENILELEEAGIEFEIFVIR